MRLSKAGLSTVLFAFSMLFGVLSAQAVEIKSGTGATDIHATKSVLGDVVRAGEEVHEDECSDGC